MRRDDRGRYGDRGPAAEEKDRLLFFRANRSRCAPASAEVDTSGRRDKIHYRHYCISIVYNYTYSRELYSSGRIDIP